MGNYVTAAIRGEEYRFSSGSPLSLRPDYISMRQSPPISYSSPTPRYKVLDLGSFKMDYAKPKKGPAL